MPLDPTKLQAAVDAYQPDNAGLRSTAADSMSLTPDVAAKANALAKRNGWRPQVVASDIPGFETEELNRQIDDLRTKQPKAADWLDGDPHRMAMVRGDMPGFAKFAATLDDFTRNVSPTYAALRGLARSRALDSARIGVGSAVATTAETGLDLLDQWNPLKRLYAAYAKHATDARTAEILRQAGDPFGIEQGAREAAKFSADQRAEANLVGQHVGGMPTDWSNPGAAIEQLFAHLGQQSSQSAPLMAVALATRNPELGAFALGVPTGTQTYSDLRAQGVDRSTALVAGLGTGAMEVGGEEVGLGALMQKSIRKALLTGPGTEYAQEFVTQLGQDAIEGKAQGQRLDPLTMLAAANDAGLTGALTGTVVAGGRATLAIPGMNADRRRTNAINTALDTVGNLHASGQDNARLAAVTTLAQESKLGDLAPDQQEAFVEHLGGQGAAVYVPAAELRTLFQNESARVAEQLTGDPSALALAGETGDVVIPLAKWVSTVAKMPEAAKLLEVARTRADGLSPKELANTDVEALLKDLAPDEADTAQQDAYAQDVAGLEAAVTTQLQAATREDGSRIYGDADAALQAKLFARAWGTVIHRAASTPEARSALLAATAARYGLTIKGQGNRAQDAAPAPVSMEPQHGGILYRRGNGRTNGSAEALQRPDGGWLVRHRRKNGNRSEWSPWEARASFDASPAFGYRPSGTPSGLVTAPGHGRFYVNVDDSRTEPQAYNPLLDLIASLGGITREDARRYGVDPAEMNVRRGIRPLFSDKGVPLDTLRQSMQDAGFLQEDDPNAPPKYDLNDVWDLVSQALAGDMVAPMGDAQADLLRQQEREARQAEDAGRPDSSEETATIDGLLNRLMDAGMPHDVLGAELEALDGAAAADKIARLTELAQDAEAGGPLFQTPSSEAQSKVEFARGQKDLESRLEQWRAAVDPDGRAGIGVVQGQSIAGWAASDAENADADVRGTSRERKTAAGHRLIEAAKTGGFFIGEDGVRQIEASARERAEGAEHDVYVVGEGDAKLAIRATANGNFGPLADITPAEYLQRLRDYNSVFPSTQVQVFGVSEDADGNAVIWSAQRFVPGEEYATQEELTAAFEAHGWEHIGQYPDAPVYRHKATGAIIDDAHTGNVLHIGDELFPIDVVVTQLPRGMTLDRSPAVPQIETPAFKAWFGDSKVVDADGKPLVVYHGTGGDFDAFSREAVGRNFGDPEGFFFTNNTDHRVALFGGGRMEVQEDITSAGGYAKHAASKSGGAANVMPVYVSLQNPLLIEGDSDGAGVLSLIETRQMSAGHAVESARKDGHDGIIVRDTSMKMRDGEPETVVVAFNPEQIKSATGNSGTFDPNNPSILHARNAAGPQGQIQFGHNPANPKQTDITLFNTADKTTFLHEASHFLLEMMGDLAADPNTAQGVRDDYAKIRAFVGAKEGEAIQPEHHEKFARSFELYLREGKAPSPELTSAFARVRRWFADIYKSAKQLFDAGALPLDDDIRAVFDRMLATDEEIDLASKRAGLAPMVEEKDAASLGLSPEQWAAYTRALEDATDETRERITNQVMAALRREHGAAFRDAVKAKTAELQDALEATPAFTAWRALSAKDAALRLSLPDLRSLVDAPALDTLRKLKVARAEGGVHPDIAAAALGFDSGDALLKALLTVPAARDGVQAQAEAAVRADPAYSDPMTDGTLPERVEKALFGSKRLAVLESELGMLARLASGPAVTIRQLHAVADRVLAGKTARTLRPHDYLVAERKAARETTKAVAGGKFREALQFKREQALNAVLYARAQAAQTAAEKQAKAIRKAGTAKTLKRVGKAGKSYADALTALLDGHELAPVSGKTIARREALRSWAARMQDAGYSTAVSDELLARIEAEKVTNLADLTLPQLADLHETIANLLHLARTKDRLQTARGKMEWKEAKALLVERLQQQRRRYGGGGITDADRNMLDRLRDFGAAAGNWVLGPEKIVEWLDEGKEGPFHDVLWLPSEEAENTRYRLQRKVGDLLQPAFDALPKADRKALDDKFHIVALDRSLSGHTILSALLNMGNASNRDKLMRGGFVVGDEVRPFTPEALAEMFSKLTRPQAELVQGIWDAVNSLWPDIVALEEEMNGITPEKIEATPVTIRTKDGQVTLRGGYFPAVYDPKGSKAGVASEDEQAKRVLSGQTPIRASTSKGHVEKRTDFTAPLLLDYHAVLSRHLGGVIGDIAYRKFLPQMYRVLKDPELARMAEGRLGPLAFKALQQGFERGAVGNFSFAGPLFGPFQGVADRGLTNVAVAALGLRVPLSLANIVTAPILAASTIKTRHLIAGFRDYYLGRGMKASTDMIHALSPMMQQRAEARTLEMRAILDQLRGLRGLRQQFMEMAMTVHQWIVPLAERAIWIAAYKQARAGGKDIATSAQLADKAIRTTQTRSRAKDLSMAEGSPYLRTMMMFAGPMVVANNRLQESGMRGLRGEVHSVPQALGVWIAFAAGNAILFDLIMGRGPDDDDDDGLDAKDWLRWTANEIGIMPFSAYPVLRDVVNYIDRGFDGGNPIVQAAKKIVDFWKRAYNRADEELGDALPGEYKEVSDAQLAKSMLDTAGVVTGIPSNQIKKSSEYAASVMTGEHEVKPDPREAWYLLQGPPKDE